MKKDYILKYLSPAADYPFDVNLDGFYSHNSFKGIENPWENLSLPLGNGALGACVFGGADTERIQITENSFANPIAKGCGGGLNNLAEIYINFGHKDYKDYVRTLNINEAIARTEYTVGEIAYKREYFAFNSGNALVVKLSADKKASRWSRPVFSSSSE